MEQKFKKTARKLREIYLGIRYLFQLGKLEFDPKKAPRVIYIDKHYPFPPATRNRIAIGGSVKLTYLNERFPHGNQFGNIIYLVSGTYPKESTEGILRLQKRGFRIVLNQDGVNTRFSNNYFYRDSYKIANQHFAKIHAQADHVVYQSSFCEEMSRRYLGDAPKHKSVIYNAVDLKTFIPVYRDRSKSNYPWKIFLIAADESRRDRLQIGIQTLKQVKQIIPTASLYIAGYDPKVGQHRRQIDWITEKARDAGLTEGDIEFRQGRYTRWQAPSVLQSADILLHPAYMDPCPNLVIEAMACGLPVVHSRSGGVPELVLDNAGIGIEVPEDWNAIHFPDPIRFANALVQIIKNYDKFRDAARSRVDPKLGLPIFLNKHERIFNHILQDV